MKLFLLLLIIIYKGKLLMEKELEEINAQINECCAMIDHFIDLKSRGVSYAADEVKYWRKMLQNVKMYKRSLRMP